MNYLNSALMPLHRELLDSDSEFNDTCVSNVQCGAKFPALPNDGILSIGMSSNEWGCGETVTPEKLFGVGQDRVSAATDLNQVLQLNSSYMGKSIFFTAEDLKMKGQSDELQREWKEAYPNEQTGKYGETAPRNLFVTDGLYPYYTNQEIRILILGRQCYGIAGDPDSKGDLIEPMWWCIRAGEIYGIPLAKLCFPRRMLRIVYGILHGYIPYEDIPDIKQLTKEFSVEGGFSFAFMNVAKASNEKPGKKQPDWPLINSFIQMTSSAPTNFFAREIEILDPDLIIGMNVAAQIKKSKVELDYLFSTGGKGQVAVHKLKTSGGEYNYLDCFSFGAYAKKDIQDFYNPIVDACKKLHLHI